MTEKNLDQLEFNLNELELDLCHPLVDSDKKEALEDPPPMEMEGLKGKEQQDMEGLEEQKQEEKEKANGRLNLHQGHWLG